MLNAKILFPGCDFLFVTLDTLRYDAAAMALERGLTPNLARLLPNGIWEQRHTPGNFTYAAHHAFFAGFLPTPVTPGPHERLFAAAFEGSETTGDSTFVFDEPNLVAGLAARGYQTICIGGVGFFNQKTPLGQTLGGCFHEQHWSPQFGVTAPDSTRHQVDFAIKRLEEIPNAKRVFLFLNVSAIHQPNRFYLPEAKKDSVESQIAALAYVDSHLGSLVDMMNHRAPLVLIICSDHGTAYGEDGYVGHRLSHPVVWDVPYMETVLPPQKFYTGIDFETQAKQGPFVSYAYSYPHKTAYRKLQQSRTIGEVWQNESRENLSLYFHIPFCERRCFYCNLFSVSRPEESLVEKYVQAIRRQAATYREELGPLSFARFAVGGGTPTFLTVRQLESLFETATDVLGVEMSSVPTSCEVSPETVSAEKLAVLKRHDADRISIGIQSFLADERQRLGRNSTDETIDAAIAQIRETGFPVLNIDLIYGIEGQTTETWAESVQKAVTWNAEEIYLYPLYVREQTALGHHGFHWPDRRTEFYRIGRDLLRDAGYEQISMRMWQRKNTGNSKVAPIYHCQEDGMIGLGCGARSYTSRHHYSFEYSVDRKTSTNIIDSYARATDAEMRQIHLGYHLGEEDQKRRYLILSLLQCEGIARNDYRRRFDGDVFFEFSELFELHERNLLIVDQNRIRLTDDGIALSDQIGPWLYSHRIRELIRDIEGGEKP